MDLYFVKIKPPAVVHIKTPDDITIGELSHITGTLLDNGMMVATKSEYDDIRQLIPDDAKHIAFHVVNGELVEA